MTALIHLLLVCIAAQVGLAQLPCYSPLRPYYPEYFTHCCVYMEWSEWTEVVGSKVENVSCDTKVSHSELRSRSLIGIPLGCEEIQTEIREKCVNRTELLMGMLGLGTAGTQNNEPMLRTEYSSDQEEDFNDVYHPTRRCPSVTGASGEICRDLWVEPIGRRSAARKEYLGELSRTAGIKRQINYFASNIPRACGNDDTQYILFLLDTSGSIDIEDFNRTTEAISRIAPYFCKQVQVAMMTFSDTYHLEFCFNCYDNNPTGRSSLSQAIRNIHYRDGWTHTGGAARCACIDLLNESCGFPQDADCLDVVIVTDGNSNDPWLNICEEVRCLHNRSFNTYVLGVGDINPHEMKCIQNATEYGVFKADDIDDLIWVFEQTEFILRNPKEKRYSCLNNGGLPVK